MRAILLCAGRGQRLRPLTDDRPKCLLEVGGRTLLDRCLSALAVWGVDDVLIVTGYRADRVEAEARRGGRAGLTFVANPDFETTNTAVSLRLALAASPGRDCLQINGDVVFDAALIGALLDEPAADAVLVDPAGRLAEEEVKVIADGGRVARIGKGLPPGDCLGEAIGLNKIGAAAAADLVRIYAGFEARGETRHFFEAGIDRLAAPGEGRRAFAVVETGGRPWIEIDTPEDYEHARRRIAPLLGG